MSPRADGRGETILLTGPPGSGKTTTALLWTAGRPHGRLAFAIDWDQIRSTIVLADELRGAPPTGVEEQYAFAARVAAAQADRITRSGVDCVVVGARAPFPPPHLAATWADLDALDPITLVLLPRPEVCVSRNSLDPARSGEFAVPEEHVLGSFSFEWERWGELPRAAVIDTSDMTQAQVVDEVERATQRLSA